MHYIYNVMLAGWQTNLKKSNKLDDTLYVNDTIKLLAKEGGGLFVSQKHLCIFLLKQKGVELINQRDRI